MGIYSSGKNYKRAAEGFLAKANTLRNEQNDIDFRRGLLANIRENRIARAVVEAGNQSDDFSSSSAEGALANIDSGLASETGYSLDTSLRTQQIEDYNQAATEMYRKYAKQKKTQTVAIGVTGMVLGAAAGGLMAAGGLAGGLSVGEAAMVGASAGQGLGQLGTGQTEAGINNLIGAGSMAYKFHSGNKINSVYENLAKRLKDAAGDEAYRVFVMNGGY